MRYKSFIFKIISLFWFLPLGAQYSEVGLMGGGTNFIGDVGDYGFHLPQGYHAGVFYRFNFNRHWSLRAQGAYGTIANADSLSSFPNRIDRNLSFQSEIWEGSLMVEFNFLEFEPGTRFGHTPYVLAGFGAFTFNPQTRYQGELYDLRELGTEGQNTSENASGFYPLGSSFFVFGMGYKWSLGRYTSLGIETTFRSTNTDYLDDVSGFYADPGIVEERHGAVAAALSDRSRSATEKTGLPRGNPQTTDWYIFTGITLQWRFEDLYEKCANFVGQ